LEESNGVPALVMAWPWFLSIVRPSAVFFDCHRAGEPYSVLFGWACTSHAHFSPRLQVTVENIPAGARDIDVWVPTPHGDAHQQITNLRVYAAYPSAMEQATKGNTMLHIGRDNPNEPFTVTISLDAHRQEHVQSRRSEGTSAMRAQPEKFCSPETYQGRQTGSKFASVRIQHTQADPVIESFRFPTLDRGTTNETRFRSI
jgi:hypothetical protein